jgi:glucose/arabinose dehydrogenase
MQVEGTARIAVRAGARTALAVAGAGFVAVAAEGASAAIPKPPTIMEPTAGARPHPEDVHMEASGFADGDGDAHRCSDWEIRTVAPSAVVWREPCAAGAERLHTHLGDGDFVGGYAGRASLEFDTRYELRVRFRDGAGEESGWARRAFVTAAAGPSGHPGAVPWAARQRGYRVDVVAGGFQLPVNVAVVPEPGNRPHDPLLYVSELYGEIKVLTRNGTVRSYAHGLLNFDPTGDFPGSGIQGVTGVAVDPTSGDVFASMVYADGTSPSTPKPHYNKVVRLHSNDRGLSAASERPVLEMPGDPTGQSHQVSNLTIGPDGMLYVHVGDGLIPDTALDLNSYRGKILRMTLNGDPAPGNPFLDLTNGTSARDYVYAYGFRNPFGGAWRAADGAHYEVENGPTVDRLAKVVRGRSYGFDGTDASMRLHALYNWSPPHAPTNIAFVQRQTARGSDFPADKMDHAYVAESGPTWATGPQVGGKRIVEFAPTAGGGFSGPRELVEYTGTGKATVSGLAAGPDGLYFTDLYKDREYASPTDRGANLLRVRYVGNPPNTRITRAPRKRARTTRKRARARFRFASRRDGVEFECKRDKRRFRPCDSPRRLKVRAGRKFKSHVFKVRATDATGTDPTPARHRWKAKRRPKRRR